MGTVDTGVSGTLWNSAKWEKARPRLCCAKVGSQLYNSLLSRNHGQQWLGSRWGGVSGPVLLQELQVARLGVAELQEGTHSLMATVKDAGERVQRTRAEAQELLKQVQNSWSRLEGACRPRWGRCGAAAGADGRVRVGTGMCGRARAGSRSGPHSSRGQGWSEWRSNVD